MEGGSEHDRRRRSEQADRPSSTRWSPKIAQQAAAAGRRILAAQAVAGQREQSVTSVAANVPAPLQRNAHRLEVVAVHEPPADLWRRRAGGQRPIRPARGHGPRVAARREIAYLPRPISTTPGMAGERARGLASRYGRPLVNARFLDVVCSRNVRMFSGRNPGSTCCRFHNDRSISVARSPARPPARSGATRERRARAALACRCCAIGAAGAAGWAGRTTWQG